MTRAALQKLPQGARRAVEFLDNLIDPTASENLDGTRSQCLSPWMIRYFIQAAQLVTLDACFRLR